ncbi:MAG: hypothetical protein ACFFEF_06190 [Candidatus Thorarchaeota archaeon]
MDWKKYTKKVPIIHEKNVTLDMESMQRFREIIDKIRDTDDAIQLDFLKEYLRLRPENDAAIDELKIKMAEIGDINYRSITDETDQKIYLAFTTPKKD